MHQDPRASTASASPGNPQRTPQESEQRFGTVAIVGQPNAGKSTLLNALVGEPLAIVTPRAQTTRATVVGVLTEGNVQVVFEDHPGLLNPRYLLHASMRALAVDGIRHADALLHLQSSNSDCFESLAALVPELAAPTLPALTLITKTDLSTERPSWARPDMLSVSATTGAGLTEVKRWCQDAVPLQPFRHDPDNLSAQPMRFFVSEFVREAAFEFLEDELPYSIITEVEEYREGSTPIYMRVTIYVERESQRGIVVGRGGGTVKAIGRKARTRIEGLVGEQVFLDLWVKTLPKWRTSPTILKRFGFPSVDWSPK